MATAANCSGSWSNPIVDDIRQAMHKDVEEKIAQQAALFPYEDVRKAVMQDVDARMAEKVEALWKKGQQTVKAFQQKQCQKNQALLEELYACRVKQDFMEEEHAKLKAICHQLAFRFHQLQLETMAQTHEETTPILAALAALMPVQGAEGDHEFMTPITSIEESELRAPLPTLPAFPFSSDTTDTGYPVESPAATIKLADALDAEAPRTPLSLAQTLPSLKSPAPSQPKSDGSPSSEASANDKSNFRFHFTLQKAEGESLGLDVSHNNNTKILQVENVLPGGAVDTWNQQCSSSGQPEHVVRKGDRIVSVNTVSGCGKSMLEECKNNQELSVTLVRGKCAEENEEVTSKASKFSFNAEAKAFVPANAGN